MSVRVYEVSGKLVEVAESGDAVTIPAATATIVGGVKRGVAVPNAATDGELATLNALLASLRTAGIIAS